MQVVKFKAAPDPLEYLDRRFTAYMAELQRAPQDNMMSELANSSFPDGSTPKLDGPSARIGGSVRLTSRVAG